MGSMSDTQLTKALSWTIANKDKFNIISVSASMGHHNLNKSIDYCPIKATHTQLVSNIKILLGLGIPTILATGNGSDTLRVDFPACIPDAIAVSAVDELSGPDYRIALYGNGGPTVDYYALGTFNTPIKRAMGTSASAVAFSSYLAKSYKGSYIDTLNYINSLKKPVENNKTQSTAFVDVLK